MLSKHFKLNEIVDAIDECYIWWQAEVIEFIGEWEVVVRWKEFGKEKSKIQINSTVRKTSEKWNVRMTKVTSQTLPQKRRRAIKILLDYQLKFQSRGDRVKFIQEGEIKQGFVFIIDTVLSEMKIFQEDEYREWQDLGKLEELTTTFRTLTVKYDDLRSLAAQVVPETNEFESDDSLDEIDETENSQPPTTKKQKIAVSSKKKEPVDMMTMIPVSVQSSVTSMQVTR